MLNAVPIVEASTKEEDHKQLVDVRDFTYTSIYLRRSMSISLVFCWCRGKTGECCGHSRLVI